MKRAYDWRLLEIMVHAYATIAPDKIIGDAKPEPESLDAMRSRDSGGTKWAAFQNHDLGSREIGHLKFMAVGPNNTIKTIDCPSPTDWRYRFVGWVSLETGSIQEES